MLNPSDKLEAVREIAEEQLRRVSGRSGITLVSVSADRSAKTLTVSYRHDAAPDLLLIADVDVSGDDVTAIQFLDVDLDAAIRTGEYKSKADAEQSLPNAVRFRLR